jgi:hypothetical protein
MSRKQATIKQNAEYNFMQEFMAGQVPGLPDLAIDECNCKELISSIEKAKAEVKYTGSVKTVYKIKKTEKLAPKKLPMLSTNYSDAFKYLCMRRDWVRLAQRKTQTVADGAVEQYMEQRRNR